MEAQLDALMAEAADKMDELRRERDSARQEVADLREALKEYQTPTAENLLFRLNIERLADDDRLVVMTQNPNDCHRWSRSVSGFTVGEVRRALAKAEGRS